MQDMIKIWLDMIKIMLCNQIAIQSSLKALFWIILINRPGLLRVGRATQNRGKGVGKSTQEARDVS